MRAIVPLIQKGRTEVVVLGIFIVSLNVIVPLCLFCLIGYGSRVLGWVSLPAFAELNRLVYKFLLPCVLFYSAYGSNFYKQFPIGYVAYGVAGVLIVFLVTFVWIACTHYPRRQKGVIDQAIGRSNLVLLGIPIAQSIYGQNIGHMAILIAFIVPLFNFLSVIVLEVYSVKKVRLLEMIVEILKNPLIVGTFLGVIANLLHMPMATMFQRTLNSLNTATVPIALIALGGTFEFKSMKNNRWTLTYIAFLRLFLIPFVFAGLAAMIGFRRIELLSLLIAFGSPTAVASNSMAQEMNGDSELAGQIIFITTILSAFSFFLWITLLNALHLL
ncbi:MAG: AEC family transporter [Sporolactobacillus sp.]|jgi:predicted permease|nr:AEC family transporter [Sporolactobacillus sp.]